MNSKRWNDDVQEQWPILVVGATGQLGTAVVKHLISGGWTVRALVRDYSRAVPLMRLGAELVQGDLRNPESLKTACRGVSTVVATANVCVPRPGDRFGADEIIGYQNLAWACRAAGVSRIVYSGAAHGSFNDEVPQCAVKLAVEDTLKNSGIPLTILRLPVFMDVYFPLIGSRLAAGRNSAGTLDRPFWFLRLLRRLSGAPLDSHGIAFLPGRAARHAFISVDDAAQYMARAALLKGARPLDLDVAGPEVLGWEDVAKLHGKIQGKKVLTLTWPRWALWAFEKFLQPFSPAAANLVAFFRAAGSHSVAPDGSEARRIFNVSCLSAEAFLRAKSHPAAQPSRVPASLRADDQPEPVGAESRTYDGPTSPLARHGGNRPPFLPDNEIVSPTNRETDPASTPDAPSAAEYWRDAFSRNIGILTESEMLRLRHTRVAIAGLGGAGGIHLHTLARTGFGKFHLADFDQFEIHNMNRQTGARSSTLGEKKIAVSTADALNINPFLSIKEFPSGINERNIDEFLEGVDVVMDGLDAFVIRTRRLLFRRARERGIPVITAGPMGFGAAMLVFTRDGMSFDDYFDIHDGQTEEEMLLAFFTGLSPRLPHLGYMDPGRVNLREHRGPSLSSACQLVAGMAATEAIRLSTGRGGVKPAPHYAAFDPYRRVFHQGRLIFGNRSPWRRLYRRVAYWWLERKQSRGSR